MEYLIQTEADRAAFTELPISAIKTSNKLQIRNVGMQKYRDDNDAKRYKNHIKDIAEDIQRRGQLVPVKVVVADETDNPNTEQFWLVDGHHRLGAIKRLKRKTIRVEVVGGRWRARIRCSADSKLPEQQRNHAAPVTHGAHRVCLESPEPALRLL